MSTTAPRPAAQRILSLDVLRGVALLGILLMNVQAFSMIEWAYFNPTAYGNFEGINYVVWYLTRLFVDTKFMSMFSMMFGASMLLIIDKAVERGKKPLAIHARRNLFLLLIGAAHGYLLWSGDILFPYALCSFFVVLFRKRRPRTLLILALVMLTIGSALTFLGGLQPDGPELREQVAAFNPSPERVEAELAIWRSGWLEQMPKRVESTLAMHLGVFPFFFFWRVSAMMFLGMALFRWGVLSAERPTSLYVTFVALGLLIGLPLTHIGVSVSAASGWDYRATFFQAAQYGYWGSVTLTLGWIGAVMLLCKSASMLRRLSPLAAVGRMAFTNYLMHTVIATTFFYGHGFGQFGRLERIEQLGFVLAVWALQLIVSPLWLKRFHYGPAEWIWRWVTYGKRPALRRDT